MNMVAQNLSWHQGVIAVCYFLCSGFKDQVRSGNISMCQKRKYIENFSETYDFSH